MKLPILFVAAVNLTACASQPHPFSPAAAEKLKGRHVATAFRYPAPFLPEKRDSSFYPYAGQGAVQAALIHSMKLSEAGAVLLREHGIVDPARSLSQRLSKHLQHRYALKIAPQSLAIQDDDPKQIAATYPSADLIIDLKTSDWGLEPLSRRSNGYRVKYIADLRIIDAKFIHHIDGKKGIVIAKGTCRRIPDETPDAPTYDQFLDNGALLLKKELAAAEQFCFEAFRWNVLTAEDPTP
jgi:hypothetical protein